MRFGHLLAGDLLLRGLFHLLAEGVVVLREIDFLAGQLANQPLGQLELALFGGLVGRAIYLIDRTHLVGVVNRVHHQPLLVGAQHHHVLFAAERITPERDPTGLGHRVGEQAIGLGGGLLATEIV